MENEENRIIETVDEDGNAVSFELIDIVEVDDKEYALLLPTEREEDEDEDEVVLMRLIEDGKDYIFESIEDDKEFEKVAKYVETMDEEDEDEDE